MWILRSSPQLIQNVDVVRGLQSAERTRNPETSFCLGAGIEDNKLTMFINRHKHFVIMEINLILFQSSSLFFVANISSYWFILVH